MTARVHLVRHGTFTDAVRACCGERIPGPPEHMLWPVQYYRRIRMSRLWDFVSSNELFCTRCIDRHESPTWRKEATEFPVCPPGDDLILLTANTPAGQTRDVPDRVVGKFDNRGRLHSTDGPAWTWRNGPSVYALNGSVVPEWCVSSYDPQAVAQLPGTERRRAVWGNYGWDRVVRDLRWHVLHYSSDPYLGTLYEPPFGLITDRAGNHLRLLVARNASPHPGGKYEYFGLPVPEWCYTVYEAQASLWAVDGLTYKRIQSRS